VQPSHVDLPNIRAWAIACSAWRFGSVSAAARAAHVSQPAATQAIRGLERALRLDIFLRSASGIVATPAGVAALERIERAYAHVLSGIDEVRSANGLSSDRVARAITSAQLQAVTAIVSAGGMSSGAALAGLARSTLHRAVRDLERALDVTLVESTTYGLRPTRLAERLARRAELAASEWRQAIDAAADSTARERGSTVVGAMPLARSELVPLAILEFAQQRPEHRVAILDGPYEAMVDSLRRGGADFLVGALRDPMPHADLVQEHLFDDPLAIIVRARHPLANARRLTAGKLRSLAWVAPRAGSPLRMHFDRLMQLASSASASLAAIECNSSVAARALLLASDRAMLLSANQVRLDIAAGSLVALPHPLGRVTRAIGLTLRNDWRPTAAQAELLGLLRRRAARM
jgi:LysR family transcriptional regulator, regulator for genes of the gallate degradation pathway